MSETVFVEEYRQELAGTGYPFTGPGPFRTTTGYTVPIGAICDASIYFTRPDRLPHLAAIEKNGALLTFMIGECQGTVSIRMVPEQVELYSEAGLFGGILVLDPVRLQSFGGWHNGRHVLLTPLAFCPRVLEFLPELGIQRLRSGTGELFSGNVVIVSGPGGAFSTKQGAAGFDYVRADYFGDPTYLFRDDRSEYSLPIQRIVCIDSEGDEFPLVPDRQQSISLVACNTCQPSSHEDALRILTHGSSLIISLGGE